MKRIKIYSLIAISILGLGISGCEKFLEEKPQSFLNADNFYQNEEQARSAVNACYLRLYNIYRGDLMMATEYTSDLSYLTNGGVDQTFGMSPSNPGVSDGIWTSAYNGIMVCNATIAGIEKSTGIEDEEIKSVLIGEAIIMRALYYYILTSVFGDVPYYTSDASASFDALMEVAQMGRMPAAATRDSLIADLQEWAPFMPQTKSSSIDDNRVGAAMAYMLIGKLALWNKKWDVCIDAMQKLKNIYGSLSQYSLTDTWFRYKNKDESIFEVQYSGAEKISNVATQMTPPRASGAVYDGVTITELGTTTTTFTAATATDYFESLYTDADPRKNTTLAYTHNGIWFNRPKANNFTGKPWPGPKFWCLSMNLQQDNNNQKVFRFADALLMLAEAANEVDDPVTAMAAMNEVKARANASFVMTAFPGKEPFREELKKERARELFGEYGRKWDLVRWGDFFDRVSATSATELDAIETNLRPYHEYYPIPQSEVDRSGGILTNDAYNQSN